MDVISSELHQFASDMILKRVYCYVYGSKVYSIKAWVIWAIYKESFFQMLLSWTPVVSADAMFILGIENWTHPFISTISLL